jgi:hypothetical protein
MKKLTFTEASMKISAALETKDEWFLELSHDKNAPLPFKQVDDTKLSCVYKDFAYSVSAKQGSFKMEPTTGLKILPKDQSVILDFSPASPQPKAGKN